jgi:hypothetical protein
MHGTHAAIAQSIQPAMFPVTKAAEKADVAPESFGLSWAKALQASANAVPAEATKLQSKQATVPARAATAQAKATTGQAVVTPVEAKAATVQTAATVPAKATTVQAAVTMAQAKVATVQAAATPVEAASTTAMNKSGTAPEKKSNESSAAVTEPEDGEDKASGAAEATEVADEEVSKKPSAPVAMQPSTKALLDQEPSAKAMSVDTKDPVAEPKKHKDTKVADVTEEATPQIDLTAAIINGSVAPVAVAAQIDPIPVNAAPAKGDGKATAKLDSVPIKRDRVAVAKSDDAVKASGNDAKPATASQDEKTLPVAEATAAHSESDVAPVATNHPGAFTGHTNDSNGGPVQVAAASVAPAATHRSEGMNSRALTEVQSSAPAASASAAQTLSAGPGQLEVGVLDGTHGWLKIRAELGTDGLVSATLTSNATAHEGLRETVPAMAGYLESESLNVGSIAVHRAAETSGAGTDLANSAGGSDGRGAGADQSNGAKEGRLPAVTDTGADSPPDVDSAMKNISAALIGAGARFSGNGIGSWLSVTA